MIMKMESVRGVRVELSQRVEHILEEGKYKGFKGLISRTFGNRKELDGGNVLKIKVGSRL